jgi:hypothetical protein
VDKGGFAVQGRVGFAECIHEVFHVRRSPSLTPVAMELDLG